MKRDDRLFIHEEVTDWQEETLQKELIVTSEDDIINAIENGSSTSELAIASIVSVLRGDAPPELIPPIKLLTKVGGQAAIVAKVRKRSSVYKSRKGKEYQVPDYIGNVRSKSVLRRLEDQDVDAGEEDDDFGQSYVRIDDPRARERAELYLLEIVPGHIWLRMLVAVETGGDVAQLADELIAKIREMVDKLA